MARSPRLPPPTCIPTAVPLSPSMEAAPEGRFSAIEPVAFLAIDDVDDRGTASTAPLRSSPSLSLPLSAPLSVSPLVADVVTRKGGAQVSTGAWMGRTGGLAQHGSREMAGNLSVACVDQASYDNLKANNPVHFDQATYDKLLTLRPL